ncbi:hypothetical protein [Cryobacterium gelidum]|uniref:Uncharacterized protein n=1 Tax=Cryobacterium gelidum TaxID=1259164 RepID=A0A4R9B1T0_9MICO|nr:hypothetical protein [Cryobacterium gelidum]TFD73431.1 hypothetical protein E3T50_00250 [Cryobacterium gelidum]
MTVGDSQPLSRRQARELARDQGAEIAAAQDGIPSLDVPELAPAALRRAPAGSASSRRSSRNDIVESSDESTAAAAASAKTAPAPAKNNQSGPASRILSRRELRAAHQRGEEEAASTSDLPSSEHQAVDAELVEAELIEAEPREPAADIAEPEQMHAEPVVSASSKTDWTPPIGHWSVDADGAQAEMAQPDQSLDELINRGIGAGGIPTTTNALILPAIPHQGNSVSPISNTGEIMITGSFDLPRSLGSTGAHPNLFDSSEMDHMMDQLDADQLGGDSAPVSASRAVSTHASTRDMLTPPKKQHASLPIVLVITTAALAVGVLALFVTGYLLGIF